MEYEESIAIQLHPQKWTKMCVKKEKNERYLIFSFIGRIKFLYDWTIFLSAKPDSKKRWFKTWLDLFWNIFANRVVVIHFFEKKSKRKVRKKGRKTSTKDKRARKRK